MAGRSRKPRVPPRRIKPVSVLRIIILLVVYGLFSAAGGLYFAINTIGKELPEDLTTALDYHPNRASLVYSTDGELIGEFFLHKRVPVLLARIPRHVQVAFIAAEDQRFFDHPGFDIIGIARAAYANYKSGATRQGASTITQQVVRMLMLSNRRSYLRKAKEVILSVRVERELSKEQILHIYLNHAYLGHGAYGVQAGAEVYFGKDVDHLTVAEGALLAGLVQAPSRYSPHRNLAAARARQEYVLERMFRDGFVSDAELASAIAEPIAIIDDDMPLNHVAAPYFVEHVRRWATQQFGHRSVFHGGLHIYTSLNNRMQRSAEAAVRDGLESLDRRIGFRGPLGHLEGAELTAFEGGPARPHIPGLEAAGITGGDELLPDIAYVGAVLELPRKGGVIVTLGPQTLPMERDDARRLLRWRSEDRRRIAVGDLLPARLARDRRGRPVAVLAQIPDVQAALLALEPTTGRVRAMVGGYDFLHSQFNRATQARRQIGSAMKPFIYAAAIDSGRTQLDVVADAPVAVPTAGGVWRPKNYDHQYHGPVTLRTALAKSYNTVSVRLLVSTGLQRVIEMMRALGITSAIPRHVSIALGTPDLSLLEVTAANAAFANGGLRVRPVFVEKVTSDGDIIFDNTANQPHEQVISPQLAYIVADLMETVVARGTGRRAQALGRPAAGKTGTSTGHRDAWFIGYTPDLIATAWVGRDDFTPIGARATGSSAALPIWLQFMRSAHPNTPPRPFTPPPDVIFVRADELTGAPRPPGAWRARLIPFARGTVPERFLASIATSPFRSSAPFPAAPRPR